MKRKILLVLLIMIFATVNTYAAQPPGQINNLFPGTDTLEIESTQPQLFDRYPITHYIFDSEKFGIFDSWANVFKAITNVLFLLTVFVSKGINYLLMACYKLNIFNLISSFFNNIVWSMRDVIFIPLIKPILAVVGIIIIFNAGIGRFMYNWRLIVNTILIFAVAFSFFAAPAFFIDMINDFSEEISGEVLARTATITTGRNLRADDAVVHLGNSFWEMTVIKPWQLIQFGDIKIGQAEMNNFLSKDPDSDERQELANDMARTNSLFKPSGTITRFVMVLFTGIIILVLDIFVGVMAGLTAILQFAAIISAIVGILAFVMALLPNMGFNVALHSLYNTFGFLLGKIGMAILLAMYFSISTVIYGLTNQYGWMMVTLLQVLLIITVVLFRKKIFGFIHAATAGQQAAINNIHKKRDTMQGLMRTGLTLYGGKKMYDEVKVIHSQRQDKKLDKKYTPLAKEYLIQRYSNEKKAAEIEAKRTGKVNYSDFVKRVDARVDKGYTAFDERDIKNTVDMMKNLYRQGNDPKNLLITEIEGVSDEKIKLKQHDLEKRTENEEYDIYYRRRKNQEKIDKNIKSDKNSKHYNRKTAIKSAIRNIEKEAAIAISEHPTPAVFGYEEIIISGRNESALGEIERNQADKEYREMKRQENIQLQEERKIVNGDNDGEGLRPLGRTVKSSSKSSRAEFRSINGGKGQEKIQSHVDKVESNEITKETINNQTEDVINENKNIKESVNNEVLKEAAITTIQRNTVNKNNDVKRENNNIERQKEAKNEKIDNVINENKNIVESVNNEVLKEVNTTSVENNESNNKTQVNKNVINKEKVNKNETTNTTNRTENIEKVNKNTENVTETNKIESKNVINEQKNITESTENIQNKTINNIEEITNTKNIENNVHNKTVNSKLNNEPIYIRTGSNEDGGNRLRNLEEKLDRLNKKINNIN